MNKPTPFLVALLILGLLGTLATAISVQPPSATVYVNTGQTIPFLVSLNTVNGAPYYVMISVSPQPGLTASANVSAYPSSGTSAVNVTVPVGVTVSGNPGVYQLNITVTEYNSSTAPRGVLATYKYTAYVRIISPQSLPALVFDSVTATQSRSVPVTVPPGASGWYIKYEVLYPNASVAQKVFGKMVAPGVTPSVNATVTPSATSGTTNATVTFNVSVSSNLKFGEVPVTVIVYEYLQGTNALYGVRVLHFHFFVVPPNARGIFVGAPKFANSITVGHVRFGNVSIVSGDMPAEVISVVKGVNSVQVLFNDSFSGIVSFQTNATPSAIYADGQELRRGYYTVLANMPLGTWTVIGGTVYVNADPANVTVVYGSTNTSPPSTSAPSTHVSALGSQLAQFVSQHKVPVLLSLAFLFGVAILVLLLRR